MESKVLSRFWKLQLGPGLGPGLGLGLGLGLPPPHGEHMLASGVVVCAQEHCEHREPTVDGLELGLAFGRLSLLGSESRLCRDEYGGHAGII